MSNINSVTNRDKLKYQPEPYWQKLATGHYLGYRPSKTGKGGTWIVRAFISETKKQVFHSLGDFGHILPNERFTIASKEARNWLFHLTNGGNFDVLTVKDACERYAKINKDIAKRLERFVYSDSLASVKLLKLTERHIEAWVERLTNTPAIISNPKNGPMLTRPRSPATINRDIVPLRAALNLALDKGDIFTAKAWKKALEPLPANGKRNLYLDKTQRKQFLAALEPNAANYVYGLCLLPLRPGALAGIMVRDFDCRKNELVIHTDKAGGGRKILLPKDTAKFLKKLTVDKSNDDHIFTRTDGRPWNKDAWKIPLKAAAISAGLPTGTTAYTLRHSTITDLVQGGLDLLTIAQISGTSVAMIEKHYGHLSLKRAAVALAELKL